MPTVRPFGASVRRLEDPKYLVGLIAFAALYGVYSIEYAARRPGLQSRLGWIEKLAFMGSRHDAVVGEKRNPV